MSTTYQVPSNTGIYLEFVVKSLVINSAVKKNREKNEEGIAITGIVTQPGFIISISLHTLNEPYFIDTLYSLTISTLLIYCALDSLHYFCYVYL